MQSSSIDFNVTSLRRWFLPELQAASCGLQVPKLSVLLAACCKQALGVDRAVCAVLQIAVIADFSWKFVKFHVFYFVFTLFFIGFTFISSYSSRGMHPRLSKVEGDIFGWHPSCPCNRRLGLPWNLKWVPIPSGKHTKKLWKIPTLYR